MLSVESQLSMLAFNQLNVCWSKIGYGVSM